MTLKEFKSVLGQNFDWIYSEFQKSTLKIQWLSAFLNYNFEKWTIELNPLLLGSEPMFSKTIEIATLSENLLILPVGVDKKSCSEKFQGDFDESSPQMLVLSGLLLGNHQRMSQGVACDHSRAGKDHLRRCFLKIERFIVHVAHPIFVIQNECPQLTKTIPA